MIGTLVTLALVCIVGVLSFEEDKDWLSATTIYDFTVKDIHGKEVSLEKYKDHVCIIVNVASHCGLTAKNYEQLQQLYEKYSETKGLRILAFPANQFAGQEPGTNEDIAQFVKKFHVTFDMFSKIEVNGDNAHPLYKWLKSKNNGGDSTGDIKWNFTKFIINKEGRVVERFSPTTDPLDMEDTLKAYF